jgi:RNA-directed DNA polymerase
LVNSDESDLVLMRAEFRVLGIQTKLHRWARDDPHRRFDDLFNLVADPAFVLVAWDRVRGNRGAKTAGVDGATAASIVEQVGVEDFLDGLRVSLRDRSFRPLPVLERMIPKAGGKLRRLGITTITDRVVQASLKLVLEPIFEADLEPNAYGYRPKRSAQDAVQEVHRLICEGYTDVVDADLSKYFDNIPHSELLQSVARRIADGRVLHLLKMWLKAPVEERDEKGNRKLTGGQSKGTPQGGVATP